MLKNFSSTKLPTAAATNNTGHTVPTVVWANTSRITAEDGSSATWNASLPGQGANIVGSAFGFPTLPDEAVIDGIKVEIIGSQIGCTGLVSLNISGSTGKDIGALNGTYGGANDKWGVSVITKAHIAALTVAADTGDISGGDGVATMDAMKVTVFWHIEVTSTPADVPTRLAYKVYSKDGRYLGLMPKVTSKFAFSQDLNTAGSTTTIVCGKFVNNETTASPILDNNGLPITDNNNLPIMGRSVDLTVTPGNSDDDAIFKNGNRVKIFLYNKWYPNGKLMFSGQMNNISFKYGTGDSTISVLVYSDGIDLDNFIARGYPFAYTTDVQNDTGGVVKTISADAVGGGWHAYGQSWRTGPAVTNIGAIRVSLNGVANVTLSVYDAVNGNLLGSVTKAVSTYWAEIRFDFAALIPVLPNTNYFFTLRVGAGQSIQVGASAASTYADGSLYEAVYAGGSGGGNFAAITGDFGFATFSGLPTTTTTYSTQDPVTGMMSGILLDYNARGGLITQGDFDATGLSITYKFNQLTIFDALKKVLEMSPNGYYSYIDLGTAELDIVEQSTTADFTIVRGKDINQLTITMSIEQVKNYLLLSGGEVSPGVNLFRQYSDNESVNDYGIRMGSKSDNRITQTTTSDAIGNSFIEENASEVHMTTVSVLNSKFDITLLTPGKTIGFRNFGNFIDDLVLQIARRDFNPESATLTLGRLPIRTNDEVQRLTRELLFEQTIDNPTAPS